MSSVERPGTIREVVDRAASAEQTFTVGLHEFLDEFYGDLDESSRRRRIAEEPLLLDDPQRDALIGAVAEHLSFRWRLGQPPHWVEKRARFLKTPWFATGVDQEKAFLIAESPLAFGRRLIFVPAEPLRRASMPRDERWYLLEEARTGINFRPSVSQEAMPLADALVTRPLHRV